MGWEITGPSAVQDGRGQTEKEDPGSNGYLTTIVDAGRLGDSAPIPRLADIWVIGEDECMEPTTSDSQWHDQ